MKGHAFRLFRATRPRRVRGSRAQEVVEAPDLETLPAIKCWPGDGGRFLTLPMVLTRSPLDGRSNLGIYRMQLFDESSTGMHWQLGKGGGFHYSERRAGTSPWRSPPSWVETLPSSWLPFSPSRKVSRSSFSAGFLRGRPTPMVKAKTLSFEVPANAEFVLEGHVQHGERALEGPFGDHFGHLLPRRRVPRSSGLER